jgi:tetratricopeptide (TPR) repeat protein
LSLNEINFMRKTTLLFIGIACCVQGLAQNNKVTSAKMHLDEFMEHRDSAELTAARQSIDEAAVNDKTKDEPKMYLYRGEVYLMYFSIRIGTMVTKMLPPGSGSDMKALSKATGEAYTNIDTNAICIAANSFIKVLQLAPKDYYAEEAKQQQNLPTCLIHLGNKALQEYNAGRFTTSLALYQKVISIYSLLNITDSTSTQNIEMAANSASKSGNLTTALNYYQKLIDLKYGGAIPYHSIATMFLKQKDSANAWSYIEKGRAQYPDDIDLIISETNFYILKHNYEKAEGNLSLSISKLEQSPDRDKNKIVLSSLYSNLANIYDHRANPRDDKGNDLPKPADYDDLFTKAETNYIKSLDITPDNFDVLYVTGALYFNRAVPITKQANDLPLNATEKFNKLMDEAKGYFLKAQPYFEKAYKIKPDDASNTNALMQVYASTGQNDKAEALKGKK